uniref:Glutamine amidotransferase type-1 domain-containing protein n=1 Tax=Steinernema glaseri TaxID=37863 RepID=A0A1I8ACK8_9BILA
MLDQIARHGLIDLDIECKGDLHIDDHHTVEDVGITLGQAFNQAIGDKKGIRRYGHAYVPLDEALSRVVIDFSGRPGLEMHVPFTRATVGGLRQPRQRLAAHRQPARAQHPPPDRDRVQGLRPRTAHGHRAGRTHGRPDAVDQGLPVMQTVAVIDYGMGNLHSVAKALEHVGAGKVLITSDAAVIREADRVVFPGVGAIRDCMAEIRRLGFDSLVREVSQDRPFLGICVGMQALLDHSEENDGVDCIGLFPGNVRFFGKGLHEDGEHLKVPHMGWNEV